MKLKQVIHPDDEFHFPRDLKLEGQRWLDGVPAADGIVLQFSRPMTEAEFNALRDGLRSIFNG